MQASHPNRDKERDQVEIVPVGIKVLTSKFISFMQCRNLKPRVILTKIGTDTISLFRQHSSHPKFPPQRAYR